MQILRRSRPRRLAPTDRQLPRPDLDMASSWPGVSRMGVLASLEVDCPASSNLCGRPMGRSVTCLAWSADGKRLVVGRELKSTLVYDVARDRTCLFERLEVFHGQPFP